MTWRSTLILVVALAGCSAPERLAFVTPAFEGPPGEGGGVAAVAVDSPALDVVWKRLPKRAGLRADRALQVLYDSGRSWVWVGDLDGPGLVALDAATGETRASLELPHEVVGIALSPDGSRLVTGARDALEAYVVEAATAKLTATIVTGTLPGGSLPAFFTAHPAFTGDGHALVQDNVNGALVKLDLERGVVAERFEIGSPVHAIDRSPGGDRLVALVEGVPGKAPPRVLVLDARTGAPGASLEIPLEPGELPRLHHGTFSPDGSLYYVANMGPLKPPPGTIPGHEVALVDLSGPGPPRLVRRANAGNGAGHPSLAPDGSRLYVVNHQETFVSVFDARSLEPTGRVELAKEKGFGHGVVWSRGALLLLATRDGALLRVAPDGTTVRRPLGGNLGELEPGW